jgi:hypothetical protein
MHRPPLPPGRIPGTHFCYRLGRPQSHNATGRIKSLKNSSDPIGNPTRDLPVCSAVPQATAPPRTLQCTQFHIEMVLDDLHLEVSRPEHEADGTPPSTAKIKKPCTSTSPLSLNGVVLRHKDDFSCSCSTNVNTDLVE